MTGMLAAVARRRIAPNVLMAVVILAGLWALDGINTQYLPDFEPNLIQISAEWRGASAEDIEAAYTIPLEEGLSGISAIHEMNSASFSGGLRLDVTLTEQASDPDATLTEIERAVAAVEVPAGAEKPDVEPFQFYERVADVLIYGAVDLETLRAWSRTAEQGLSDAGIARIDISGVPDRQRLIQMPVERLVELDLGLPALAEQIAQANQSQPAGLNNNPAITTRWRLPGELERPERLAELPLQLGPAALPVTLGQVARVSSAYVDDQPRLTYQGLPAVRLSLSRASGENTLGVAQRLDEWRGEFASNLPNGLDLEVYNENWKFVQSRIGVILDSGAGGILLVLAVLFLFLNHRLAFWVATGIPVIFLATLVLMNLTGNSINLISLLGFLVALGIIVDDAIVVGEETYRRIHDEGEEPESAAVSAARRMLPAVVASSITTMAAFLPLLLVTGQAGTFTISVPLVVIFAIAASLVECFLILPGHLAHSLKPRDQQRSLLPRRLFERGFNWFRQRPFRGLVRLAVRYRMTTFVFSASLLGLAVVLIVSGRVGFVFFPPIEQEQVTLEVRFAPGTPVARVSSYLDDMAAGLRELEQERDQALADLMVKEVHRGSPEQGALFVALTRDPDQRISNDALLRAWRDQVTPPAGLLSQRFVQPQQGPGTAGVSVQLRGGTLDRLKAASIDLQADLRAYGGLREVRDDLPLAGEQLALQVRPDALASGLSPGRLSALARSLAQGVSIQSIPDEGDAIDLRVEVSQRADRAWPQWQLVPLTGMAAEGLTLGAAVTAEQVRAIDQLNRVDRQRAVEVTARVSDPTLSLGQVNAWLRTDVLTDLAAEHGVSAVLTGDQASQAQFLRDVQFGAVLGLVLIFGALAWVFDSWLWPFPVLAAIPFALTGAIAGHWLLGLDLSALSIYGLFGLSGIVVNSGIVLLLFYRDLRASGWSVEEAIVEASVQRLRPVLLTTLTTVAGLSFLLSDTSFDAQFLIPVAAGIVFGLTFGTFLILVLVPALLVSIETWRQRLVRWWQLVV